VVIYTDTYAVLHGGKSACQFFTTVIAIVQNHDFVVAAMMPYYY